MLSSVDSGRLIASNLIPKLGDTEDQLYLSEALNAEPRARNRFLIGHIYADDSTDVDKSLRVSWKSGASEPGSLTPLPAYGAAISADGGG